MRVIGLQRFALTFGLLAVLAGPARAIADDRHRSAGGHSHPEIRSTRDFHGSDWSLRPAMEPGLLFDNHRHDRPGGHSLPIAPDADDVSGVAKRYLRVMNISRYGHDALPEPISVPPSTNAPCAVINDYETWQILPGGLLFQSYLAGDKEPRMGSVLLFETNGDTFQESTMGARIGLVRYGTAGTIRPEGWQLDVEGAAFMRQNWTRNVDVDAVDFRVGVPITWRRGPLAAKFGYYHLSSHVGDEFLARNPGFQRINYVRDSLLFAMAYDITPDWLVYAEAAYAFNTDGGAEPWEFQFGFEYSPVIRNGFRGSPFFAINAHLREEFDFGGSVNVLFGWQWRSRASDGRLRIGAQYYNGKSMQYSFFNRNEELAGIGIWYDF